MGALGLHCCTRAFSSLGEQGLVFTVVRGLPIALASLVAQHRLLGAWVSVVVSHEIRGPIVCEIFLHQKSNPCLLHWQEDS